MYGTYINIFFRKKITPKVLSHGVTNYALKYSFQIPSLNSSQEREETVPVLQQGIHWKRLLMRWKFHKVLEIRFNLNSLSLGNLSDFLYSQRSSQISSREQRLNERFTEWKTSSLQCQKSLFYCPSGYFSSYSAFNNGL